jgi:hypothetical protein
MGTQRVVELMVVMLTIWVVVNDIKVCRGKGRAASPADKTVLVVTSGQTAIGRLDGFALNRLATTSADVLG